MSLVDYLIFQRRRKQQCIKSLSLRHHQNRHKCDRLLIIAITDSWWLNHAQTLQDIPQLTYLCTVTSHSPMLSRFPVPYCTFEPMAHICGPNSYHFYAMFGNNDSIKKEQSQTSVSANLDRFSFWDISTDSENGVAHATFVIILLINYQTINSLVSVIIHTIN